MNNFRHDPAYKGIFVQRNVEYKDTRQRQRKPFCVTFPLLSNVNKKYTATNDVIFPSHDFATFQKAFCFAKQWQAMDSRIKQCPIYLLDTRWVKSSTERYIQKIG